MGSGEPSGEPTPPIVSEKTPLTPAQADILERADAARRGIIERAIASGKIGSRIPMTQNQALNEGMQLRGL
jgi:hypothetical protein